MKMQQEEKTDMENPDNKATDNEGKEQNQPEINKSEKQDFKKLYEEANDKFLRLYSEFENYKRRTAKERIDLLKSAGSDVVKAILPALDDFERAIKANEQVTDAEALKEGFKMIAQKLQAQLQSKGIKQMELKGTAFDPEISEAIANLPVSEESQKGKVAEVVENGYYMNDVIIRYAKVVVGN